MGWTIICSARFSRALRYIQTTAKGAVLCRPRALPLPVIGFRRCSWRGVKKKRKLSEDFRPASRASVMRCRHSYASSSTGILTRFPFSKPRARMPCLRTAFAVRLGSTHPLRTALPAVTLSSSAVSILCSLVATSTEICTRGSSTPAHAGNAFPLASTFSYSPVLL